MDARCRDYRRSAWRRGAIVLASLIATSAIAQAQRTDMTGTVRDTRGQPVLGARVALRGSRTSVLTDSVGRFVLAAVPQGLTFITAQGAGHFPTIALLQFTPTDTVDLLLEAVGVRDDSVAAMQDAEKELTRVVQRYTRAMSAARSARAFTDRDIARLAPAVTTDLLVGVVGFTVQGNGSGAQVSSARDGCSPTIFVDEIERVNFSLNEIRPTRIKLLLAYNGYAVIPATLRSVRVEPTCGAISILSK